MNAKVMSDPRLKSICDSDNPPFDYARMAYGGFKTLRRVRRHAPQAMIDIIVGQVLVNGCVIFFIDHFL